MANRGELSGKEHSIVSITTKPGYLPYRFEGTCAVSRIAPEDVSLGPLVGSSKPQHQPDEDDPRQDEVQPDEAVEDRGGSGGTGWAGVSGSPGYLR
jgi:hypothetical protein